MRVPRLFGVREAASYLNFLGNISVGSELPVSISKEPVPSATLAYHLELASQKPKTAWFFIHCKSKRSVLAPKMEPFR